MENELLIIPDKVDVERDSIAKVWEENGGEVLKLGKFWIKPYTKELKSKIEGIKEDERLICSDIILVEAELRSFILNNQIQDLAFYEGNGSLEEAENFINLFLEETTISFPKTFILDIGFNRTLGWFIIEFNASWGAGLNFCQPQKVINCIRTATVN